jgi:hypothetical protein
MSPCRRPKLRVFYERCMNVLSPPSFDTPGQGVVSRLAGLSAVDKGPVCSLPRLLSPAGPIRLLAN